MKIALFEPYNTDSHEQWANGLCAHSQHDVRLFKLPGSNWKWRMHGGAITLVKRLVESGFIPELVVVSEMMDLALLRGLLHEKGINVPCIVYFHENQLDYPWSESDPDIKLKRDRHYSFINYSSALVADSVIFNSVYHRDSFVAALLPFLNAFPDHQNIETIHAIEQKSVVIYPGMDTTKLDEHHNGEKSKVPLILWNHRWEYDKNPNDFFNALYVLSDEKISFNLGVCGREFPDSPPVFREAAKKLKQHIISWGFLDSAAEYYRLLWRADLLPVTSFQDYFGYSVLEALYCGATPLLPSRLVYPEHIQNHAYFYSDQHDLISKLRNLLMHPIADFNERAMIESKYGWKNVIQDYDNCFEKTVNNFKR